MSDDDAPLVGKTLCGKYHVERLLGRGGMGEVYAAFHAALGTRVALKVLVPGVAMSGVAVARFIREAQAASKIRGDYVVRVLDVG